MPCTKVKFTTRKDAKDEAQRINRLYKQKRIKSCYKCPECGYFHTTRMNRPTYRKIQERINENKNRNVTD